MTSTAEAGRKAPAQLHHQMHPDFARYIPSHVAGAMSLNGNVHGVEAMRHGMSGNSIVKVDTDDRGSIVVKYGDDPQKIRHEINRHGRLSGTPLEPYVPPIVYASHDLGIVAYPYIPGSQLREGLRTETIDPDAAQTVLDELLSVKAAWWGGQPKDHHPHEYVSMQREEWDDTLKGIGRSVDLLGQTYGASTRDIVEKPLVFAGQTYPSLGNVIARVGGILARPPEYVVTAHNDATGANIVHNSDGGEWKLLDPEWTGPSDPAEAFPRIIKYITSATASRTENGALATDNERLHVSVDVRFPPAAIELQKRGLMRADDISAALGDGQFLKRSSEYLAGSYLRELALATKRGGAEIALFTMIKAAEALSLT